jgi:radical SAM protein with 4Fe4S-binding SPASM domain
MDLERYQDFSLRLHGKVVAGRVPVDGTIEVTRRCPLACVHCYNNLAMSDPAARRGELTLAEHCRIVDEIAEAGCIWLLYTGGEPFVRRDFLDIYGHAKRRGMLVTIFTNGTMINPKVADFLAEWRPFAIEVTLYGRTRETYERITGIPGSFDRCMRGIQVLLDRKLPLKLKTMAVSVNRHEIWEMQRFAEDELGVEFRFDAMINPRIECLAGPLAVRLAPEEVVEFDLRDSKRTAEWQGFCERFKGSAQLADGSFELYNCGGGINSFAIDPEGKLTICVLDRIESYDLRTGNFRAGWDGLLRQVRSRTITRQTKCVSCQIKSMCGMCPANGELENGDPESPVDFLCRVAHLRAHAFGIPVPAHGACEYCEGGAGHEELVQSLGRLARDPHQAAPRHVAAGAGPSQGRAGGGRDAQRDSGAKKA